MRRIILIAISFFSCLLISSCDTILGPPGSEPPMPQQGNPVPYDMFVEGEPSSNIISMKGGLFIWKVGDSWHVRTARLNIPNVVYPKDIFVGNVGVENGFVVTDQRSAKLPDEIRVGVNDIAFRFEVEKDVKGLDFSVRPAAGLAYCVNFDVRINNVANPEWTYIGRTMYSPVPMPLKICVRK